jgi:hypothetical protein
VRGVILDEVVRAGFERMQAPTGLVNRGSSLPVDGFFQNINNHSL